MQAQVVPNTINDEGIYTGSIEEQVGYPASSYESYPQVSDIAVSPDGTMAAVWEYDEYEPHPVMVRIAEMFADVEDSVRSASGRIMQHPYVQELNTNEEAQHSLKQRLKFMMAMVALVGVAVIFFLGQLSRAAVLPEMPEIEAAVLAPAEPEPAPLANNVAIAANSTSISPVFSPQVQRWEAQIINWAREFDVDPNAVATVMQIESCGDFLAESYAGAQGLFQVMPFHFESHEVMKDPDTNARRGIAYLKLGLEITNGDIGRAFAGYNGGHSIANKTQDHWAHETQRYYYWGTGIYADATAGRQTSDRLDEWMAAGGASLCSQADSRTLPTSN